MDGACIFNIRPLMNMELNPHQSLGHESLIRICVLRDVLDDRK